MARKSAPRVGLDADVERLMQGIAVYHGGNLTAAVNYALRLAAPAILQDLQTYRPLSQPFSGVTTPAPNPSSNLDGSFPHSESSNQPSLPASSSRRSNAERLQGAKL